MVSRSEASRSRSREALGKPKSIEEAPTKFKRRRIAIVSSYIFMKTSATTPSSGLSEEGSKRVNIAQRRVAASPTSTDTDAINGRSTLSKATQPHGRQSDQITNGTWNFQRLEGKNTINDQYAVMDETSPEAAARRRSLQIASQTTTRRSSRSPAHNTNSTATEQSQASTRVNANWMRTGRRRSSDAIKIFVKIKAHQLDRSSKDVEGPKTQVKMTRQAPDVQKTCLASQMDQWTSQLRQGLAIGVSAKVGSPKSTTFGQDAVTKRRRSSQRQGRSSHADRQLKVPSQLKSSKLNLLMKVVEVRKSSCKRILTDRYNSCAFRNPEVAVTSVNVNEQRTDDQGTRWRTSSKGIPFSQREGPTPSKPEPRHQTPQECRTQPVKDEQDATTLIRATKSKESEAVRTTQSTASQEDS
ncbi:unnamed protein product [Caenorhabditis nigoni]